MTLCHLGENLVSLLQDLAEQFVLFLQVFAVVLAYALELTIERLNHLVDRFDMMSLLAMVQVHQASDNTAKDGNGG